MRRGTGRIVFISALTTIVGSFIVRRSRVQVPGFSD
jgi:hypothetical protein